MKQFRLEMRFRTVDDIGPQIKIVAVQATCQKGAKVIGKRLAAERQCEYGGKYWFMGLVPDGQWPDARLEAP